MAKLTSVKSQSVYHSTAIKTNSKARTSSNSSSKTASSSSKSSTSRKVSPQQAKKNYEQAMSKVKNNAVKTTNRKISNLPKSSNVKKDSFTKANEKTKTEKQAVITQKAYSKAVSTAKAKNKSTTTTKNTANSYESEKIKYLQNEIKNTSSLYKKSELQKEIEFIKIKNKNNNNSSTTSNTNSSNKILFTSTNGINLSNGQTEKITCQSTDFGGEFPGWFGCVSTTIAAMFRINDGAVGKASELVNCNDDGTYPTEGLKGYSFYQFGETLNNNGINQNDALDIIKDQLLNGKTCGVKLERNVNGKNTDYGHTVLCSGIISGVSIKEATWNDLLFNDVGRGSSSNRDTKQISEMNYSQTSYSIPSDGNCCVIIDTTK